MTLIKIIKLQPRVTIYWYNTSMVKNSKYQARKHADGTLWQDVPCECGKILFKRCLTDNKVQVLVDKRNGQNKYLDMKVNNDPGNITLTCPQCSKNITIASYSEIVNTEELATSKSVI